MSKDKSGPAFPQPCTENGYAANSEFEVAGGGMTLRDYIAIRAMQSVSLAMDNNEQELIANASYQMADAMLKARSE